MSGTVDSAEAVPAVAVLGDFRLGELLGSGGMGQVYRAEQLSLRRAVALKVLPGSSLASREARSRFVREAALVAKLSHPAIVPVYQAGEQDGVLYYAMELVDGLPLDDYVHERHLGMRAVVDLMARVCDGIEAAHRRGILHRDLKPANILVDGGGQPRILDFGLATMLTAEAAEFSVVSGAGGLCGTLAFMAPEQTLGDRDLLDVRTDLYAVGVMLYRLCTGRPPTDLAGPLLAVLEHIRTQDPAPPGRLARMPSDLEAVLLKALAKEPDRRYQSAAALAADLRAVLSGHPVSARRPTTVYRLRRYVSRHRGAVAAAAAVALLVAGLTIGFIARLNRERGVAVAHAQRAEAALADLRGMAPTCGSQARLLIEREEFDDALAMVELAIRLDPEVAEYHLLRGHILQDLRRIEDASAAYEKALSIDRTLAAAAANLRVCRTIAARDAGRSGLSRVSSDELHQAMVDQKRYAEAVAVMRGLQTGAQKAYSTLKPVIDRAKAGNLVYMASEGTLELHAQDTALQDLKILSGMPLSRLMLSGTPVMDLSPLRGMPLTHLSANQTRVEDLSPLKGMPLETLDLTGTQARDLAPLRGMPLRWLRLDDTLVTDLAPLRGMPLETLHINGIRVADLSPLQGMRLRELHLRGAGPHAVDTAAFPANPKVPELTLDLTPLRGMPLQALSATAAPIADISPLAGMPLTTLGLDYCPVSDLSPLRGMPLQRLELLYTLAVSLEPLRALPLQHLKLYSLNEAAVIDPAVLSGLPLQTLYLMVRGTTLGALRLPSLTRLTLQGPCDLGQFHAPSLQHVDLSQCWAGTLTLKPLAASRDLRSIILPNGWDRGGHDLTPIRNLPKLETINGRPWVDFWREVDAR